MPTHDDDPSRLAPVAPDSPAIVVAEYILKLRRSIAPPGSRRERLLRSIYGPVVNRMIARARSRSHDTTPRPTVVQWQGLAERGRALPACPHILILKLDHIGDFVVALPAFEHLRAAWPSANLTLICGSWNHSLAEETGLFDAIISFNFFTSTNAAWRGASTEQYKAFKALRLGSFDLAIDLRHDFDTRALLNHVDTSFRAGFSAPPEQGGDYLDISLPDMEHISVAAGTGRPSHAGLRLQLLAFAVTAVFAPHAQCISRIPASWSSRPSDRRYAILAPGAGSPIRVWPLSRLIEVGRAVADHHGLDIIVTGSKAEHDSAEAIVNGIPGGNVRNLAGTLPLAELPALIAGASLYVGYDTGTTHLAAALGVPTVAILSGVPALEVWYPTGNNVVVIAGRIACSPCYLKEASQCPYGVPCLTAIKTEDVLGACEALLDVQTTEIAKR